MYNVIVIGGGPGGYAAAIRAAQLKGKVALVEGEKLGGTCVNRGCIPSKVWLRAAYLKHWVERSEEFGIKAALQGYDPGAIVKRKNGVARDIQAGMEALLKKNGIDLIRGQASLKSEKEISVDGKTLEAGNIIIATGSSSDLGKLRGAEVSAWTPEQVFDLEKFPKSVLILGGGPIEVEMAALLSSFGAKTILAVQDQRILPREDYDTSLRLAQILISRGIEIIKGVTVDEVTQSKGEISARCGDQQVKASQILVGARKPNTDGLGVEKVGIKLGVDGAIQVNDKLETSVAGIYAIGDVTGGWMLSHASSAMGIAAVENALGGNAVYRRNLVSRGLWTIPEVAAVGMTEEEAEKEGFDIEVGTFPYPVNGLAMARGQAEGAVKIISDAEYGQILGVHIIGAGATEIIGEAVMAIQLECTVDDLAHTIRLHPTFSECIMDASREAASWALYLPPR